MILFLEMSIRKSIRSSKEIASPQAMFDHEGRRRYVAYVDCSCHDVAFPINTSPKNTGLLRYQALCDNIDEREHLVDVVSRYRLTDIIIGGCDSTPLPQSFQKTMESANCRLRGLNLLDLQGATPQKNPLLHSEVEIQLENLVDPWTSTQRIKACQNRMFESNADNYTLVSSSSWPEIKQGSVRISTENWSDKELQSFQNVDSNL